MSNIFEEYVNSIGSEPSKRPNRIMTWWANLAPEQRYQIGYIAGSLVGGLISRAIIKVRRDERQRRHQYEERNSNGSA